MKKLLSIMALVSLLSCQKELTIPDVKVEAISAASNNIIINDASSVPVDQIIYNECTQEEIHITGAIKLTNHSTIKDSATITYHGEARYDNVVGVGLVTGNKYQGSGRTIVELKGTVTLQDDPFGGQVLVPDPTIYTILNRATFTTAGGGNNLSYDLTYHLHVTKDGIWVENIDWKFAHCQ